METKLTKDLSTLTGISENSIRKLLEKTIYCICSSIEDTINAGEDELSIDLDYGTLKILVLNDNVKYKFIPSKKLDNAVTRTIANGKNELATVLEEALIGKIENVYKTFF